MLFNSAEYLFLFLPFCLLLHYFLKSHVQKAIALVLLSAWFYMAAFPVYIFLLFGLIAVDFAGVILMDRCSGLLRKFWLWICIGSNVSLLASFKYWNFLAENSNLLGADLPLHSWILPVGLSFHTFQSMSYVLEVYRKAWPAERNLLRYSLYILFFPQMVAGPVERPQNILPQLHHFPPFSRADFLEGLFQLGSGLFMKAVVADRLALFVNPAFEHSTRISAFQAMLAMLFFALQIYADFSGYSNMALGSARMLGIRLMVNFQQPYLASSLSDFWRRWHISLSTWFRDYLYIPLGGSRKGPFLSSFNLLLVFLISGLWHGAGWNFLLWGLLHGVGLVLENHFLPGKQAVFSWARWLLTQSWVIVCWVFFRAVSMENATQMFAALLRWNGSRFSIEFSNQEILGALLLCLAVPLAELFHLQEKAFNKHPVASIMLLFTAAYFLGNFNAGSFLYFQF
jgi:D-alanyl-lipoteichoic acid acyltransferase DltB (MBOAT superfamily)